MRNYKSFFMTRTLSMLLIAFVALSTYAGAPLKGVDVKLGKNPGGMAASRMTNSTGKAHFGILPKGSYYLIFSLPKQISETNARQPARPLHALITVEGPVGGPIQKRIDSDSNSGRVESLNIELSGKTELKLTVLAL